MKYVSTRSKTKGIPFDEVLLTGLAPDGGLYVPESYPQITKKNLKQFQNLSYAQLAFEIISKFTGESIDKTILQKRLKSIYSEDIFNHPDITPIKPLFPGMYLQDLSTGPSLAFKDLAMQCLASLMEHILTEKQTFMTILGASSGDTVSAAEEALKNKQNISVFMLTPKEGMSPFQKAQAGSILATNIYNISIDGPFDLCQDLVKQVNQDQIFKKRHHLSAVNSINWGRICAQIVYYFKGYLSITKNIGDPLDVVVPSGNFGNILAGYIAKQMGLPLKKLIIATNENKVLDHFFKTGHYQQNKVQVTSSPSMDISKASNIERLFFDLFNRNPNEIKQLMNTFEKEKKVDLSKHLLKLQSKLGFFSGSSTKQDQLKTIKKIYKTTKTIIDPHTAAGVHVATQYQTHSTPILCMETAKPFKFEQTIQEALGFIPERPTAFKDLETKKQKFYTIDKTEYAIKSLIKKETYPKN